MAINQPIIVDDQAENSWKLEVTNQANIEEARVNALASRLAQLEGLMGVTGGFNPESFVDVTVAPGFNAAGSESIYWRWRFNI